MTTARCSKQTHSSQRGPRTQNQTKTNNWVFGDRMVINRMAGGATAATRRLSKVSPGFQGVCLFSHVQLNSIIRSDQLSEPSGNNVADRFNPEEKLAIASRGQSLGVIALTAVLSLSHRWLFHPLASASSSRRHCYDLAEDRKATWKRPPCDCCNLPPVRSWVCSQRRIYKGAMLHLQVQPECDSKSPQRGCYPPKMWECCTVVNTVPSLTASWIW